MAKVVAAEAVVVVLQVHRAVVILHLAGKEAHRVATLLPVDAAVLPEAVLLPVAVAVLREGACLPAVAEAHLHLEEAALHEAGEKVQAAEVLQQ